MPQQPLLHGEQQVELRALRVAGASGVPGAFRSAVAEQTLAQFGDRHHLDPDHGGGA
ncbi:hypothetical protein OOK13_34440 [Streptomyces sp. NBC_00378]|uniref:hypothetical protein n=1 Tax=unclassified Streptomyces TaxID=2593676 RepID=UPI002250C60D|nr:MULTISPECIES: hypothetical protein [unclassified Streptomyces]MCX5113463.1 hypothetical protein [Streptomyces sp. NBC_00378]